MKKPFFSIVIPTYNRPEELMIAVKSVLRQDFINFEVVISDNSTNDQTQGLIKSFQDKRVRYSHNQKNIGYARNLYLAIKKTSGKYIFLLGDDDIILKNNTLANIFNLIKEKGYGYIRLKFLYYKNFEYLYNYFNFQKNIDELLIKKGSKSIDIYQFLYKKFFHFVSGNVFINLKTTIPELERAKTNIRLECFYIKHLFKACKLYGGFVDNEDIILAKWSTFPDGTQYFDVINNQIFIEKNWNIFFSTLNSKEKQEWIKRQTDELIFFLPSLKFYTNTKNLLLHIRRVLKLNRSLYFNLNFYLSALVALIMPRFIWRRLRSIFQRIKKENIENWQGELNDIVKFHEKN